MEKRHSIIITDFTKDELTYLLVMAEQFEMYPSRELLKGKVIATLFYEPLTKTRLSFETAANRLGTRVIGFSNAGAFSVSKGETLKDTMLMVSNYADLIVIRHYTEGAAQHASEVTPVLIINTGDGIRMHPSQCLLDLYSIHKTQGTLKNLNIHLVGDLKYNRMVHLSIMVVRRLNPTFHFITPNGPSTPMEYKLYCQEGGIKCQEHTAFDNRVLADADILYMARIQKERLSDLMEYEHVRGMYILRNDVPEDVKDNLEILHPLSCVNEAAYDVDDNPHVYYIQQAQNGLHTRQTTFSHCLGITPEDIKQDKTIIE